MCAISLYDSNRRRHSSWNIRVCRRRKEFIRLLKSGWNCLGDAFVLLEYECYDQDCRFSIFNRESGGFIFYSIE